MYAWQDPVLKKIPDGFRYIRPYVCQITGLLYRMKNIIHLLFTQFFVLLFILHWWYSFLQHATLQEVEFSTYKLSENECIIVEMNEEGDNVIRNLAYAAEMKIYHVKVNGIRGGYSD